MSAPLNPGQFKRSTRHTLGHNTVPEFSHRLKLVGLRPETKLGNTSHHGVPKPASNIAKPATYVLHSPKQRVRKYKGK